jgi:phage terminase large subunit-like protein
MNIRQINYDRWGIKQLNQVMDRLGITAPLQPMGQGYYDMSPAVKSFQLLAVNGHIRHGNHPLLRWCFANAVVTRDPADNCKLDKSKAYGRIDVAVAAVMAVGAMKATTATPEYDIAALIG